jgi:hypothetical protein
VRAGPRAHEQRGKPSRIETVVVHSVDVGRFVLIAALRPATREAYVLDHGRSE